jgi:hypothetical protein
MLNAEWKEAERKAFGNSAFSIQHSTFSISETLLNDSYDVDLNPGVFRQP